MIEDMVEEWEKKIHQANQLYIRYDIVIHKNSITSL